MIFEVLYEYQDRKQDVFVIIHIIMFLQITSTSNPDEIG